jgi:hypothetical protein
MTPSSRQPCSQRGRSLRAPEIADNDDRGKRESDPPPQGRDLDPPSPESVVVGHGRGHVQGRE